MSKIKTQAQSEIDKVVGERLRAIRAGTKTKAIALATAMSVRVNQLRIYEKGEQSITVPRLIAAAEFMGVEPVVLLQDFTGRGSEPAEFELEDAYQRIRKLEQDLEKIMKISRVALKSDRQ